MSSRTLKLVKSNATSYVLLVESGDVIGAWDVYDHPGTIKHFQSPGNLDDWSPTWPEFTRVEDYGDDAVLVDGAVELA